MALIFADRVLETSTTTGAGVLTLAGAVAGFRAASAVCADTDTLYYYAEDVDANGTPTGGWETGIGSWGTGNLLTRTTVHASSNAGAAVVWAAGTRRVALALTATGLAALLATKQVVLVSGTNLKSINGVSLLGSGDMALPKVIPIACSDETTALTAGASKVTFRMPYAMALSGVRASLTTAQATGALFTVDVKEGGVSILSTLLTLDNAEKTSTTAATPAVISDAALADDAEITVSITQIGDGTAQGLKVYLIGV